MYRSILVLAFCALTLVSQTKKILVDGNAAPAEQLQSVSPKVRVIAVTPHAVMRESVDAGAFVGSIRPEPVPGRQESQMGASDEHGSGERSFQVWRQRSA
jgi:hypothetical protein